MNFYITAAQHIYLGNDPKLQQLKELGFKLIDYIDEDKNKKKFCIDTTANVQIDINSMQELKHITETYGAIIVEDNLIHFIAL